MLLSVLQVKFNEEVLSLLESVLKLYKANSVAYKTTSSTRNDYLVQLDVVFPWLEEEKESGAGRCPPGYVTSGSSAGDCTEANASCNEPLLQW